MSASKVQDKLNQRGNAFSIVLNDCGANLFKNTNYVYHKFVTMGETIIFIACIFHGNDYIEEEGRFKTPHYHVVIQCDVNCRVGTMLNSIVELFKCNENQVSIEKCSSVPSQVRYLIHADDWDKYQYKASDIASNDLHIVNEYLSTIRIGSVKDCVDVVKHFNYNLETIMIKVSNYKDWRSYIKDLIHNRRYC